MGNPLVDPVEWVTTIIESLGYVGVALLVALENVFPPIPSELILPLAGFAAARGVLWLPGVIVAATAGAVAGALVFYTLGRKLGRARLRDVVRRYGKYAFLEERDLERAQEWFERHGARAVLLGRLIPTVRSLISIPAGVAGMPLGRFVAYTAVGSGIWNSVLVGIGWVLGERWELVRGYARYPSTVVTVVLAALLVWFLWRRWRNRRRRP